MNFKISEWKEEEEEEQKEVQQLNQQSKKSGQSKLLILIGTVICEYDDNEWTYFPLIDQDKISDLVIGLKCPSLLQISPITKESLRTYLLSGGYDYNKKTTSRLCLTINQNQSDNKEEIYYSLNFGYSDMITPRFLHKTINIDNKYFLAIGGKNNSDWLDECELFLCESRKWILFDKLNSKRSNFDAINYNNKIYVFGGFENLNKFSNVSLEMCDFTNISNLSNIKWKPISIKLPNIAGYRVIRSNQINKLLVIGGCNDNNLKNEIYSIDIQTNEVVEIGKLNSPRANFHILNSKNQIFVLGGTFRNINDQNNVSSNYIEKIDMSNMKSELISFDQTVFLNNITLFLDQNNLNIISNELGLPYSSSIETIY